MNSCQYELVWFCFQMLPRILINQKLNVDCTCNSTCINLQFTHKQITWYMYKESIYFATKYLNKFLN